jgi:hypothetical protein
VIRGVQRDDLAHFDRRLVNCRPCDA